VKGEPEGRTDYEFVKSNAITYGAYTQEQVAENRNNFELYTLAYIESSLSGGDKYFGTISSIERANDLLALEYVEYPYDAEILRCKVLMKYGEGLKREKLLTSLNSSIITDGIDGNEKQFSSLLEAVYFYRLILLRHVDSPDEHALIDSLGKYLDQYKDYWPEGVKRMEELGKGKG
jgi:hypothetical protein